MRKQLVKSMKYGESVDMMYMSTGGRISKRRIEGIQVHRDNFSAYCHLRGAKRTFRIDHILALVPVYHKESMVI